MEKEEIWVFVGVITIFLLTPFVNAYITPDGEYSPYPAKAQGGSLYQNESPQNENRSTNPLISLLILIGILLLVWMLLKRKR